MWLRRFILFVSIFSMVVGLIVGLSRASFWNVLQNIAQYHFLIMSGSFFGTLITLERIVTIKQKWAHLLPLLNGSSIVFFLLGNVAFALFMLFIGSLVMLVMYIVFWRQHKDLIHSLFILSGVCYAMAVLEYAFNTNLFLSVRFFELFFLITIVAERLELARFINVPEYFKRGLLLSLLLLVIISFFQRWNEFYGIIISLTTLGLIQYDIAKKNIKAREPHRFRGWALMVGYYWLLIHGISFLIPHILTYDIQIHTFFLGFVMNMVFAHVTIILPAVLKVQYDVNTKVYYMIWFVFQMILIYRFLSYRYFMEQFSVSALVNVIVVILFFMVNIFYLIKSSQQKLN